MPKRSLRGFVVSDASDKTIVVKVSRRIQYPLIKKVVTRSKKFHAHDALNTAKIGDQVLIEESKPYSKLKAWKLAKIFDPPVKTGKQADVAAKTDG